MTATGIRPILRSPLDGTPRELNLPRRELGIEVVDEAIAEHHRIGDELQAMRRAVRDLRDGPAKSEAKAKDRAASADAMRAGRKDPGPKHLEAHEKLLTETVGRRDALKIAYAEQGYEVVEALRAHQGEMLAARVTKVADARAEKDDAVAALREAFARYHDELALERWARGFAEERWDFVPMAASAAIPGMATSTDGDGVVTVQLDLALARLEALGADEADPPPLAAGESSAPRGGRGFTV